MSTSVDAKERDTRFCYPNSEDNTYRAIRFLDMHVSDMLARFMLYKAII